MSEITTRLLTSYRETTTEFYLVTVRLEVSDITMQTNTVIVIKTDNMLVSAMNFNGPAENEATFRTVNVTTPPNGHPDLLVLCLLCLQHIPSA